MEQEWVKVSNDIIYHALLLTLNTQVDTLGYEKFKNKEKKNGSNN